MGLRVAEDSALVRAFAEARGCSVQWARLCRREKRPEWLAFVSDKAVPAAVAAVEASPADDLSRAREMKEKCWSCWQKAEALVTVAARREDAADVLPSLLRAVREARKAYEAAQIYERKVGKDSGRYIPVEAVAGIRAAAGQLADVLGALPDEVASRVPEDQRVAVYAAVQGARKGLNAGLERISDYIYSIAPCLRV